MDEWNNRFELLLMPVLEDNSRKRVDEAVANWTPTQVFGQGVGISEHPFDEWLDNHRRTTSRAAGRFVNSLVSLDHGCENIFVVLQNIEDSGLVHWFIGHRSTVYTNGGSNGLPN